MATKQRDNFQDLTSGFEEAPIVNSRPIDVFVTPAQVPTSPAINELINSLERFNPALANYKAEEYKTFTVEEEAKAEREFNKTKKDIKKAVKDGTIPAGASPEFINKWVKLDLKKKARKFKTELFAAYQEQGILGATDPEAFNIFFDKFSAEFKTKNKIDGYDPVNVAEGFLPFTMTAYEQLNSQHITGRVSEMEKNAKIDLQDELYSIVVDGRYGEEQTVNNYFLYDGKKPPEKNKRLVFIAENIFSQAQELIDAGMPAREVNEVIRNTVKDVALNFEDERLLKIFDLIPTADGGTMGGTLAVQNIINDTKRAITDRRILRINQENTLKAYDDKQDTEAIINQFTNFIDERGIENISPTELEKWFQSGVTRKDNKQVDIDAIKRGQIFTLYQNYQNAINLTSEDKDVINNFYSRITQNPYDIEIQKDLIDALGTDINDTTYRTITNFVNVAQSNAGHPHIKHPDFIELTNNLDDLLTDFSSSSTQKINSVTGIRKIKESAFEFVQRKPDATKAEFDEFIEKEADKILISLLSATDLMKITKARELTGDTDSFIMMLKKISSEYSKEDKLALVEILDQQKELHNQYFLQKSITSEEYGEQMNNLNNQITEIAKKYNEEKPKTEEVPEADIFGVPLKELLIGGSL